MTTPILLAAACLATNLNCATPLPRGKAEPSRAADVAACDFMGPGYIKAPGTDTCIKIGGYMRSEGAVTFGR